MALLALGMVAFVGIFLHAKKLKIIFYRIGIKVSIIQAGFIIT